MYYNMLLRGLERYLNADEASSRITYSEKELLRTVLPYSIDGRVTYIDHPDKLPPNADVFLDLATERFQNIPWLILE